MNREIKFRAWNSYAQKFIYFSNFIITDDETLVSSQDGFTRPNLGNWIINSKDVELQQYTGLKDKNGKEVFEGDILVFMVKKHYARGFTKEDQIVVEFGDIHDDEYSTIGVGYKLWLHDYIDPKRRYIEVIGNLLENPELLK